MSAPSAWLHALVDYAGLFPPAKLPMRDAVRNYAAYAAGPQHALLGRFVVPQARLAEFSAEFASLSPAERARPWELSVLTGPDGSAAWAALRDPATLPDGTRVSSIETKVTQPTEVAPATAGFPAEIEVWVEVAPDSPALTEFLAAIAAVGHGAKIRTGGVTPDAFPAAASIVRFFRACLAARVPCKATAGLHHAWRGDYRLTYEPESPHATMHGFLNVFLAAALLHAGGDDAAALRLLEETQSQHFSASPQQIAWREFRFTEEQLAAARRNLCRSFGSCSFTEPVADLQGLHWL